MTENTAPAEAESAPPAEIAETPNVNAPPEGGSLTEAQRLKKAEKTKQRIQNLRSDKRAAMEYADFHKKRSDDFEAQLKAQQQPQTVEPKIEDYESAAEWQRDFVTFTNSKAESIANKAIETRLQSMETERSQAQIDTSFNTSMDAAAEKHEDFWDVVTDPRATFMNGPLLETVKQMPNAGELAYHINSNPAEGHKLAAMNATQMAAELGRLDATLNSQKPESKPNLTNAPDPPSNISGAPVAEVDLNKVGVDDYMRLRREQLKKRRGY